ncbi:velvet factor-domain-containing protein [Circinella umbellata]|nr:velvet factor-domain-containing protein [Circinella umbellata]
MVNGTKTTTSNNSGTSACTYRFIPSSLSDLPKERNYDIIIRQQPKRAKMSVINERDRRPIEPPPILQMQWVNCSDDEIKKSLQSPFYFLVANIVTDDDPDTLLLPSQEYLSGSTVSSLYRLRDIDNSDGGFFVFGDLAVKKEGKYRLHFSLFEIVEGNMQNRKTMLSDTFTVYLPKRFPGPFEATFLSRTFCDQGVKMRIRKEHRLPSVSGRKRKVESIKQSATTTPTTNEQTSTTRTYKRKAAYVDNRQNQDVHFGRWQSSLSSPQPISNNNESNNNNDDSKSTSTVALSPPSRQLSPPQYHFHQSLPRHEKGVHFVQQQVNNMHRELLPSSANTQYKNYVEQQHSLYQPPNTIAQQSIPSPPPSSGQHHFSSDLAGYHFDKMGHSNSLHGSLSRQPTPPPILADIEHHPHRYGDRLPPLRSIMGDMVVGPALPPLTPPSSTSSTFAPSRVSIHQLLSSQ